MSRDACLVWFFFFCRPSPEISTLHYITYWENGSKYRIFQLCVRVNGNWINGAKSLGFFPYKRRNKLPLVYSLKWDSDTGAFLRILRICLTCNFIKSETPVQVFSCEFWEICQPVTLLRTRHRHRCFFVNFEHLFCKTSAKGCF